MAEEEAAESGEIKLNIRKRDKLFFDLSLFALNKYLQIQRRDKNAGIQSG